MRDAGLGPVTKIGLEPMRDTGSDLSSAGDRIKGTDRYPLILIDQLGWQVSSLGLSMRNRD